MNTSMGYLGIIFGFAIGIYIFSRSWKSKEELERETWEEYRASTRSTYIQLLFAFPLLILSGVAFLFVLGVTPQEMFPYNPALRGLAEAYWQIVWGILAIKHELVGY